MKKKHIFITIILLLLFIVLVFRIARRENRCGDGLCQELEMKKGSCPADCEPLGFTQVGCGNKICEPEEDEIICPQDCKMKCQERNSLKFIRFGKDIPLLGNSGVQPKGCRVKNIVKMGSGSQPDFSYDGSLIAFTDKVKGDYEVFLMNADGPNRHCITCNDNVPQEFKNKHKGKPTFYPLNSHYLLLSVENEHGDHGLTTAPGIGDNHDLWLADLEQNKFWRLTHLPKDSALQYPRFSSDGKKLLWSERYEKERLSILKKGCEWGFWKMKLADFIFTPEGPQLTNIIELEPGGQGYYEPHGFFPGDNNKIIMTAMIKPDKSAFYGEFYTYDFTNKQLTCLASTDDIHYEMALYSPDGKKISFMSGPFLGVTNLYKADLYLMDADGKNRLRLTYFNQPDHEDYAGANVQIQKESWSPDGTQMVSAYLNHQTKESTLFMIAFEGACGIEQ